MKGRFEQLDLRYARPTCAIGDPFRGFARVSGVCGISADAWNPQKGIELRVELIGVRIEIVSNRLAVGHGRVSLPIHVTNPDRACARDVHHDAASEPHGLGRMPPRAESETVANWASR